MGEETTFHGEEVFSVVGSKIRGDRRGSSLDVPVPRVLKESVEIPCLISKESLVSVHEPQVVRDRGRGHVVEDLKVIPQERVQQRNMVQIVDLLVPQAQEHIMERIVDSIIEVVRCVSLERMVEQMVNVSVL